MELPSLKQPLRQATLCLLVKDDQVLLAMKKRGFGQGRWNGVGGKPNEGETIEETAIRETQEEIEVIPKTLKHIATLNFYFPHVPEDKNWNQQVSVFIVDDWQGEPKETEEMAPQWFNVDKIPYDQMWSGDRYWLPQVLRGTFIQGDFIFDKDQKMTDYQVQEIIS